MHPIGDRRMKSAEGLDMVQRGFKVLAFLAKKAIPHNSVGDQGGKVYLQKSNEELERTTQELKKSLKELKKANKKILKQQKAVIEEERLKVLLQMAGATAHELNQPLMALLGNIELMGMNKDNPEKVNNCMVQIEEAGQRIADIVKKIQTIRHVETRPYLGNTRIINLEQKVKTLSVEDSDDDFEMLNVILKDHHRINVTRAMSIEEAMQVLEQEEYGLIFLDYLLPDGNGLDFLRRMERKGLEIPVVVITGQGDEMTAARVIQAGAYDYLPKDKLSDKSLSRIIFNTLEKDRLQREIKEAQKKMADMSTRDVLTGLHNRRYFMEALEREVSRAKRYETNMVLCMIDLDHFKRINDSHGHPAGDMVLTETGKMLKRCVRRSDLACRYGGEEFALILPDTQTDKARMVCNRFREMVSKHDFIYNSSRFQITLSIGIALFNHSNPRTPLNLISRADEALYQAKEAGRDKIRCKT
jgi:two-component system cell cycle response regulator